MDDFGLRLAKFWAGGFLYSRRRASVFLHHRDNKTRNNPNKWAFFGGLNEGPETFRQCFAREMREETGLEIADEQILPVRDYLSANSNLYRAVFYVESDVEKHALTLGEGAGFDWVRLNELDRYDLVEDARDDLAYFVSRLLVRHG
jgi:8-oxo-dGTP pyrophosphatase MutT (NUDIX family)